MGCASAADHGSCTGIFGVVKHSLDGWEWLGCCSSTDLWAGFYSTELNQPGISLPLLLNGFYPLN